MNTSEITGITMGGVTLLTIIVAVAKSWQHCKDRDDEQERQLEEARRRIEELECRCEQYDRFAAKFASVATDLKWITKALDERDRGGHNHRGRDDEGDSDDPSQD